MSAEFSSELCIHAFVKSSNGNPGSIIARGRGEHNNGTRGCLRLMLAVKSPSLFIALSPFSDAVSVLAQLLEGCLTSSRYKTRQRRDIVNDNDYIILQSGSGADLVCLRLIPRCDGHG